MQSWFKLCNLVYWLALAVWLGALMTGGIAAAFVFGTLPDLGVELARYAGFYTADPAAHANLAAGHIMERVFTATAFIQVGAVVLAILTMLCQFVFFQVSLRRASNFVRGLTLSAAAIIFGFYFFGQAPRFNAALRSYWRAAEAGDLNAADAHKQALDALHPRMELAIQFQLICVIAGVAGSAVALTPTLRPKRETALEKPRLAK